MPVTLTRTAYAYAELSERAKDAARDAFRDVNVSHDWWDAVYEDAKRMAGLMGIDIADINFRGFWSQGDGARFRGTYAYRPGGAKAIRAEAPQDVELHRIADGLQALQRRLFWQATARIVHQGSHYEHSGCMTATVEDAHGELSYGDEADFIQLFRDFADWIYAQLEREHDYLTSDEAVVEAIEANEYLFDEEGRPA